MEDMVCEVQDLKELDWAEKKLSPGTPGCFLKAYKEQNGKRIYYKLSNYDSYRGIFGHECVNELIVSRLLDVLHVEHVKYILVHANIVIDRKEVETWITASENFRGPEEEKMPFDMFFDLYKREEESPLEFADRFGWGKSISQMLLIDYLIANRDRHGANIEILRNSRTGKVRLAPFFDQGVSLLFSTYGDESQLENFDVLQPIQANNFIGSKDLEYNLRFVKREDWAEINPLKEKDFEYIMKGMDKVLSPKHIEKIQEMIWKRWQRVEALCNQK